MADGVPSTGSERYDLSHVSPENVGLELTPPELLKIRRRRRGSKFAYLDERGNRIRNEKTLSRIAALAIPPAYRNVRISANPKAHLQAIGRDEAGREQRRFHADWEKVRETRKAARLCELVTALPRLRSAVRRDLSLRKLEKAKAVACAVALIDAAHIRVGEEAYLNSSGARGAATLLKRQATIGRSRITLSFQGKGGAKVECGVECSMLARALGRIASLPGRRLLQYRDEHGAIRPVQARDVNNYLKAASGISVSAKDLRMLAASAAAAGLLSELDPGENELARRRQIAAVMRDVSEDLGNTPTVARKSYVHDIVLDAFEVGELRELRRKCRAGRARSREENLLRELVGSLLPPAK